MKPFIITGCGRSGTRYLADLLSVSGVMTGWEGTVNPVHATHKARDYPWLLRRRGFRGDANWLAVPYLRRFPPGVKVWHQVRHPLKVVRSLLVLRFFGDDYLTPRYQGDARHINLAVYNLPGLNGICTAAERCLFYWLRWNLLCEDICAARTFSYRRYRLEDELRPETGQLNDAWQWITGRKPPEEWQTVPNAHYLFGEDHNAGFTWANIPDGAVKDSAMVLAHNYGYD